MAKKWDHHHAWWQRNAPELKTSVGREFREFSGFVVPVLKTVHEQLHEELDPPIKPTTREMLGCMAFLATVPLSRRTDPLWGLEMAMQHFVYVGADNPDREPEAHEIRHHLASQIGILSSGLYLGEKRNGKRYARK